MPDIVQSVPRPIQYAANWQFSTDGVPHYTSNVAPGLNTMYAKRMEILTTGTITDFTVLIGATSSGNLDAGVYTFDGTTYTKAWTKGSTSCPSANTWTSLGSPGVQVYRGQIVFCALAFDNTSVTPARLVALGNAGWHNVTGLTYPKLAWSKATSFALPDTVADSGVTTGAQIYAFGIKIT